MRWKALFVVVGSTSPGTHVTWPSQRSSHSRYIMAYGSIWISRRIFWWFSLPHTFIFPIWPLSHSPCPKHVISSGTWGWLVVSTPYPVFSFFMAPSTSPRSRAGQTWARFVGLCCVECSYLLEWHPSYTINISVHPDGVERRAHFKDFSWPCRDKV